MQDNKNGSNTQNLQQKLLNTRYSVVDRIINIKTSIDKERINRRRSQQKLEQIRKKIIQLQNQDRQAKCLAKRYQHKLEKLQESQNMVSQMAHLKGRSIQERQKDLMNKRSFCSQLKDQIITRKQKSFEYLDKLKKERVNRFKQQNFNYYLQKQRKSETDFQNRRKSKDKVRSQEAIAKQRLKRYSQFKLAQAKFNYQLKKGKQQLRQKQLAQQLKQYQRQKQDQESIFRKTQILTKQVNKAQSIYLTSAQ